MPSEVPPKVQSPKSISEMVMENRKSKIDLIIKENSEMCLIKKILNKIFVR